MVSDKKDCERIYDTLASWACFAIVVAAFLLTYKKGLSHGLTMAISAGLIGAQTQSIVTQKDCFLSQNHNLLIFTSYAVSAFMIVVSIWTYSRE